MKVSDRMEEARKLGNGTMDICVRFNTEEELAEAEKWLKGKHKVKNISIALVDKRPLQEHLEEIAQSTLPKKGKKGKKKK